MNGPLYMQASNKAVIVRRVKRKGDSPWRQLMRWFVENQIGMCDKAMDPKPPWQTSLRALAAAIAHLST
jgi:hypothetical protein